MDFDKCIVFLFYFIFFIFPHPETLPAPSPSHPSGSSRCTSPEHPCVMYLPLQITQNSFTARKTSQCFPYSVLLSSPLQPLVCLLSTVLPFPYLRSFNFTRRKTGFPNSSQWGKKGIYSDKYLVVEIGNKWFRVSLLTWGFNLMAIFSVSYLVPTSHGA